MGEVDWRDELHERMCALDDRWFDRLVKKVIPSNSLCDYRASYAITHPWIIVNYMVREVKFAWQRVFKFYDDRVVWSIDYYLAKYIPIWMMELKERKMGIPFDCFEESALKDPDGMTDEASKIAQVRWDGILDEIADGFNEYMRLEEDCSLHGEEYKEAYKAMFAKVKRSFELMSENFGNFWD